MRKGNEPAFLGMYAMDYIPTFSNNNSEVKDTSDYGSYRQPGLAENHFPKKTTDSYLLIDWGFHVGNIPSLSGLIR